MIMNFWFLLKSRKLFMIWHVNQFFLSNQQETNIPLFPNHEGKKIPLIPRYL